MKTEDVILETLKKQRAELCQHPKLNSLSNLYSTIIQVRENQWKKEQGIVEKSITNPIDFKPLIDAVAEENIRNGVTKEILKESPAKCIDCEVTDDDSNVRYIAYNKLRQLTYDE